jgi:acetyl-CoA carboxylase carboxyl transferase subunit beta
VNLNVCPNCKNHFRIDSRARLKLLLDEGSIQIYDSGLTSTDPLNFSADDRPYKMRLQQAQGATGLSDAVINASGTLERQPVFLSVLEFSFIGGSMGAAMGEGITRGIEKACQARQPMIVVSASSGARMMEGTVALMQMAKIASALSRLHFLRLPYISVATDPTTGGVLASLGMLGDLNIAEPGALLALTGARVVEATIGHKIPKEARRSESTLKHGMLDAVVQRKDLKRYIGRALQFMTSSDF